VLHSEVDAPEVIPEVVELLLQIGTLFFYYMVFFVQTA
jgi:hypothetical protein